MKLRLHKLLDAEFDDDGDPLDMRRTARTMATCVTTTTARRCWSRPR